MSTAERARKRAKAWYRANRERAKKRIAIWQKANPEKVKANRKKHKKSIRAGQKRCYQKRQDHYIRKASLWNRVNRARRLEIARASHLLRKYGLQMTQYLSLLKDCGGKCLLCLEPLETACVDHNHKTGEVRGLLCRLCNSGIGMFKESPEALRRAADYLEN